MLLCLSKPARETNLLTILAGIPTSMPIATALHGSDPAGPIWALAEDPARRRRLDELPSDHGPHTATNPNRYEAWHSPAVT